MTAADGIAQVNTLATHTATSAWMWGSDFLIVIVLFALFFLFAWYMGKGPFIGLMVSLYVAYAFYAIFPYNSLLPSSPAATALAADVGLYAVFGFISYLILRRTVVSDFLYVGLFGLFALSFLGACFVLALAYHVFPVHAVYTFTPAVDALFAPKQWFFWWFTAPLLGLFFLAR